MAIFVHSGNQMIQQGELVMKRKWVFAFEEGDGKNKMLLGGKGANLCEMTQIGLNVPPGSRYHDRRLSCIPRQGSLARGRDGRDAGST
jgi:hypothetical protein